MPSPSRRPLFSVTVLSKMLFVLVGLTNSSGAAASQSRRINFFTQQGIKFSIVDESHLFKLLDDDLQQYIANNHTSVFELPNDELYGDTVVATLCTDSRYGRLDVDEAALFGTHQALTLLCAKQYLPVPPLPFLVTNFLVKNDLNDFLEFAQKACDQKTSASNLLKIAIIVTTIVLCSLVFIPCLVKLSRSRRNERLLENQAPEPVALPEGVPHQVEGVASEIPVEELELGQIRQFQFWRQNYDRIGEPSPPAVSDRIGEISPNAQDDELSPGAPVAAASVNDEGVEQSEAVNVMRIQ